MATDIASLQMTIDSADLLQASAALNNLAADAQDATGAVDGFEKKTDDAAKKTKSFAATTNTAGKNMGGMTARAGQAGIQIQQLVGQIQGGQNAMAAFSMQAADLGIVLGAPLVGVVISLSATLTSVLMTALSGSKNAMKELAESVDVFGDSFEQVSAQMRVLAAEQVKKEMQEQQQVVDKLNRSYNKQAEEVASLNKSVRERMISHDAGVQIVKDENKALAELDAQRQNEIQSLNELTERYEMLTGQREIDTVKAKSSAQSASQYLQEQIDKRRFVSAEERAAIDEYYAHVEAARHTDNMLAAEQMQAEIDRRRFSTQAEREAIEQFYAEVDALRQADNLANANALQEQLNQRRMVSRSERDAIAQFDKDVLDSKRSLSKAFVDLMSSQSRELFEIGKVGAASEALVNANVAATKALAVLGPIAGPIAAGVMYAAGVSNAYNIMNRKFGDTSPSGAPNIPDVPVQSGGDTIQNTQTTINIAGDVSQPVFDQLQDLFDNDAVIIRPNTAQARALRA